MTTKAFRSVMSEVIRPFADHVYERHNQDNDVTRRFVIDHLVSEFTTELTGQSFTLRDLPSLQAGSNVNVRGVGRRERDATEATHFEGHQATQRETGGRVGWGGGESVFLWKGSASV